MPVLPCQENEHKKRNIGKHMSRTCKLRDGLKGTITLGWLSHMSQGRLCSRAMFSTESQLTRKLDFKDLSLTLQVGRLDAGVKIYQTGPVRLYCCAILRSYSC